MPGCIAGDSRDRQVGSSCRLRWKVDAYEKFFATGDATIEPYCMIACKLLEGPPGSITKKANPRERGIGKVMEGSALMKRMSKRTGQKKDRKTGTIIAVENKWTSASHDRQPSYKDLDCSAPWS